MTNNIVILDVVNPSEVMKQTDTDFYLTTAGKAP